MNHIRLQRSRVQREEDIRLAIQQLNAVADAQILGAEMWEELNRLTTVERSSVSDEQRARVQVAVVSKLYEGGRLSYEEYAYLAAYPVLGIVDNRWLDDVYEREIEPLHQRLEELARSSFDEEADAWLSESDACEYTKLNLEIEARLRRKSIEVLREFGLSDLADVRERNPKEFERIIERGRRAAFHPEAQADALRDAIMAMRQEAELASSAGAYSIATAAYGAAIEGLLALRCMRAPVKARRIANATTGKKQRPSPLDWSFDVLIDVCEAAGWLPEFETEYLGHSTAQWAHYLRELRNRIHLTRTARKHAWVKIGKREFETARAVYEVIDAALRDRKSLSEQSHSGDA
ncbi:MAG TPA: hypothetical protein VF710_26875 [Longimicrobium sp.]